MKKKEEELEALKEALLAKDCPFRNGSCYKDCAHFDAENAKCKLWSK